MRQLEWIDLSRRWGQHIGCGENLFHPRVKIGKPGQFLLLRRGERAEQMDQFIEQGAVRGRPVRRTLIAGIEQLALLVRQYRRRNSLGQFEVG